MEEKDTTQEPTEANQEPGTKTKDGKRRVIVAGVAAVVVVALCAGGYAAWRVHENRLDEQARTDCAKAAKKLDTSRTAWEKLLKNTQAGAGRIQTGQVKDAKTVEALDKAMNAKAPTSSASCTTGTRDQVDSATKAIRKTAKAYGTNTDTLRKAAKAVEASKLDRTVADAARLLADAKGKVKDDATRQTLDRAIKARDEQAIVKAVKAVNDSKAAKDKADAETKAKKEVEEAAAAAKAAQQQAATSANSGYSGSYGSGYSNSGYSNSNRSYSNNSGGSTSSNPSISTPSQSTGSSNSGSSSGSHTHYDWEDYVGPSVCSPDKFCPIG